MPRISFFYGIIITMNIGDHNPGHIHAHYQGHEASFDFEGSVIAGEMPRKQMRLIQAWIELHQDELIGAWYLASHFELPPTIAPLQ